MNELAEISRRLGNIEADLREHMRRTSALEERIQPLELHVANWAGAGKALTTLGLIAGILAALWKVIG